MLLISWLMSLFSRISFAYFYIRKLRVLLWSVPLKVSRRVVKVLLVPHHVRCRRVWAHKLLMLRIPIAKPIEIVRVWAWFLVFRASPVSWVLRIFVGLERLTRLNWIFRLWLNHLSRRCIFRHGFFALYKLAVNVVFRLFEDVVNGLGWDECHKAKATRFYSHTQRVSWV